MTTKTKQWDYRFDPNGGYDNMTGAYEIIDENKKQIATVDLKDYGQKNCIEPTAAMMAKAETNARMMSLAPEAIACLKAMIELHEKGWMQHFNWEKAKLIVGIARAVEP